LSLISRVYPNPASEYIILETSQPLAWIEIIQPSGKTVLKVNKPGNQPYQIPIGMLPRGIYFLRALSTAGKPAAIKFIRQ